MLVKHTCVALLALSLSMGLTHTPVTAQKKNDYYYAMRTVTTGLDSPWEMTPGPDGRLWCTERAGYVCRIDPDSGTYTRILDISDRVVNREESGLLGMALHPSFADSPYVYLSWTDHGDGRLQQKIVRYTYDGGQLVDPQEFMAWDAPAIFHAGSRLAISKDHKLIITTGETTANIVAQYTEDPRGKVLRLNLDGTIPDDNPVPGSAIYARGFRNPQGLVVLPDGRIYTAEHGPATDDEINLILSGANYGWPLVMGYCDEEEEIPICEAENITGAVYSTIGFTYGMSALEYYTGTRFPEWQNRLLAGSLKSARIQAFELGEDGTTVSNERQYFSHSVGRIRDFAAMPDGRIFICTSNRDGRGRYPFPTEEDDRIYELLHAPVEAAPTLEEQPHPDTVFANVGDVVLHHLRLENTGNAMLSINNWWTGGENASDVMVYIFDGSLWLRENSHNYLPVQCTPAGEGVRTATVTVSPNNISSNRTYTIVIDPNFPDVIYRGDTIRVEGAVGARSNFNIHFINSGEKTVDVNDVLIEGENASEFMVNDEHLHTVLAPGQEGSIAMEFIPASIGEEKTATISVTGNLPRKRSMIVIGSALTVSVAEKKSVTQPICAPQPADQEVFLIVPAEAEGHAMVQIRDMFGRLVDTFVWMSVSGMDVHRIATTAYPSGAYSISIATGSDVRSVPMIVRH